MVVIVVVVVVVVVVRLPPSCMCSGDVGVYFGFLYFSTAGEMVFCSGSRMVRPCLTQSVSDLICLNVTTLPAPLLMPLTSRYQPALDVLSSMPRPYGRSNKRCFNPSVCLSVQCPCWKMVHFRAMISIERTLIRNPCWKSNPLVNVAIRILGVANTVGGISFSGRYRLVFFWCCCWLHRINGCKLHFDLNNFGWVKDDVLYYLEWGGRAFWYL